MKKAIVLCTLLFAALGLSACGEESKINGVKQAALNNCQGKTMQDLVGGLLQNPVWSFEKGADGKEVVSVRGVVAGDSLPDWVREQKLMDITFRFPLDPKSGSYDPAALDGFPSISSPEGVLQAYKVFACQ
ncbi:hypothetical protein LJC15_00660 [Desulfovibrio sp. OttesenSCG-928-G11]|nr:hypothetical protein [Desulfovibrio sp. OttesenSCG-928-G11]